MPLYDYACQRCSTQFEALRPVAQRTTTSCPSCGNAEHVMLAQTNVAAIASHSRWQPRSPAQRLTGGKASGPGARKSGTRSNVLHVCAGKNCSYCGS